MTTTTPTPRIITSHETALIKLVADYETAIAAHEAAGSSHRLGDRYESRKAELARLQAETDAIDPATALTVGQIEANRLEMIATDARTAARTAQQAAFTADNSEDRRHAMNAAQEANWLAESAESDARIARLYATN